MYMYGNYTRQSSCVNNATPHIVQNLFSLFDGISRNMTKFVECPVVESIPLRSEVL